MGKNVVLAARLSLVKLVTSVEPEMRMMLTLVSDLQLIQRKLFKCCCSESGNATSRNRSPLSLSKTAQTKETLPLNYQQLGTADDVYV